MITRSTAFWNRIRLWFSPTEWFVRWLRLPKSEPGIAERGLVLIQIDGLSRSHLEAAMENGRMPFLSSLLRREHYVLHDFYSGLPSTTPSVQGELFYGVPCAVPAFGFRDHRTGQVVRMFARDVASDVEARISHNHRGLLSGGSAYCNLYGGGADEVHFCAANMGWSEIMGGVRWWKLIPLLVWHVWSILRTIGLMLLEFVLACASFVRGAISRREYWQELLMIPARVVVVILMRELAIIGATMDVARGVPMVQLNLLGYDEQAHRRGPGSVFAHRTLKGIDQSMRRLWSSAHRSPRREYDVWIFSDHGQIETTPFQYVTGKEIADAACMVVDEVCGPASTNDPAEGPSRRDGSRASWLSTGWLVGKLFGEGKQDLRDGANGVQVTALGPLGLIYSNRAPSGQQRAEMARRLVRDHGVPLAFVTHQNSAIGFSAAGEFDLRDRADRIFGPGHPFAGEIASDTIRLCHHPDAGDVVVSGWVRDGQSLSFAVQNGAHAGPSPDETHAFVLAPSDVELDNEKGYLRPKDLRSAATRFLHTKAPILATETWSMPYHQVRVMTYNVHACVGMDHRLDARRIARVIAQSHADVVALQELDVCRARSGFRDQAEEIARLLEMECHFHPAWQLEEERYGDAILSRVPMQLVRKGPLPSKSQNHEPRGAIWVELELEHDRKVQVLNTHLSIYPGERNMQAAEFAKTWVRAAQERGTTIVCGDFNAQPSSPAYRSLAKLARDVQSYGARHKPAPTFFSPRPLARIDHIFVSEDVTVERARVLDSRLARIASDHVPLLADLVVAQFQVEEVSSLQSE